MKKITFLIVIFILFGSISLADSIGDISVSFCNSGSNSRSLDFAIKAGIPYEFCVEISNSIKDKIPLSIGFVDGEITNDELHNKACSYKGSLFSPYVDFNKNKIVLDSDSIIQKTGTLFFPLGYSGEVHGCLVYTIPNNTSLIKKGESVFDVVVRKANFIDGYVVGDFVRSIIFLSGQVSYYKDNINNDLVISLPFISKGLIPEFVSFTGTLNNVLGYERSVVSSKILSGDSSIVFRFADIPFYQGKYDFSFEGLSVLDTRLDLSYLPDSVKQSQFFSYTKTLFLVPWMLVFGIIGFFVALFVLRLILKIILRR